VLGSGRGLKTCVEGLRIIGLEPDAGVLCLLCAQMSRERVVEAEIASREPSILLETVDCT
jgi:hypothetical protein